MKLGSQSPRTAGESGEVRARAGAGAARVAGDAGEVDEDARRAVKAPGPPVKAVKCERELSPGRRGLQERPERSMKLPVRQSKHSGRR